MQLLAGFCRMEMKSLSLVCINLFFLPLCILFLISKTMIIPHSVYPARIVIQQITWTDQFFQCMFSICFNIFYNYSFWHLYDILHAFNLGSTFSNSACIPVKYLSCLYWQKVLKTNCAESGVMSCVMQVTARRIQCVLDSANAVVK